MRTLSSIVAAAALLASALLAACGPAVDEPAGDTAGDATERAASTPVADARPADTFQCLQGADVAAAPKGPQATDSWIVRPAPGEAVDLREATYTAHSRNAVRLRGIDAGICAVGGTIVGDWDHCASWRELKDENHACLSFETNQTSIHGLHCFNVHDGIRPRSPAGPQSVPAGGEDFDIAHVWLEYIRDDCIENDTVASGTIRDSLLDGCFAGVSVRPGKKRPDLTDVTVTLDRVLMRLEPMPHPNRSVITTIDGIDYGHLAILKTYKGGPHWVIKDSVFAIHGDSHSDLTQGFDQLKACSNNTIVWLGEGPFPAWYPEDCFTVTTDVKVWQEAVADWHARHPEVGKARKPRPELMGSVALDCRSRDRSG
jgi:hypothetical protein